MKEPPKIIISSTDMERLERLLESTTEKSLPFKSELEAELSRAEVVEPDQVPRTVVTMGSTVRFAIEGSASTFSMTLVYPSEADGSSDRISVFAPVGSALLGMSEGDEISWPRPGGGDMRVRIEKVLQQPQGATK